jgi:amino acid transporter
MSKIKLSEAISIGIGGMVGGGIFAVLGLATQYAKGGTPVAFLFAGFIAILTAYTYGKLSTIYPSKGGTVTFINNAFGRGVFSGGTNNLLWVSYVIMIALYASVFGIYASNLLKLFDGGKIDQHIYSSLIIIIATAINYTNVKIVSVIEKWAVAFKMLILIAFIIVGFYGMTKSPHLHQLNISTWPPMLSVISGGMIIFVAYEGFELIANVAPDIENAKKNTLPAFFISTIIVIVLYFAIAVITVGSLSFSVISNAQDYVLAEAAKPVLGQPGFIAITIAALVATFSAINASLYGGTRVNYELAEDDEFPHEFTKIFWNEPIGLLLTCALTLILTNSLNLQSMSTSGSAGFLLIFAIVNISAIVNFKEVKGLLAVYIIGTLLCFTAFFVLVIQQLRHNIFGVIISLSIIVFCYVLEFVFKKTEKNSPDVDHSE